MKSLDCDMTSKSFESVNIDSFSSTAMSHLFLRFVVLADVVGFGILGGTKFVRKKIGLCACRTIQPSARNYSSTKNGVESMTSPEAHAITIITKRNFQSGAAPLVADEGEEKILEEIEDTRDDDDFIEDDLFF